ncbi:MAG: DNA-directed RNA polymerase subunit beta' [Atopobiaceae bacterium]|nr:DNA-directed RNA polymerase subunit beta' [Atopobiaceae bacterium]
MADFETTDFDAIKISLASADKIRSWSHGEVKKPETINYRTLKPEKDGLFCEKIFGPVKDWECSCGKYKGIRFKGIVCERCGVEVTSAKVRRDRMGHIELAAPVSHIWYFKSPTSFPLARLLDIKSKDLEKVLYFASFIITNVDAEGREADAADLKEELAADLEQLDAERDDQIERLKEQGEGGTADEFDEAEPLSADEIRVGIADLEEEYEEEKQLRKEAYEKFMQLEERELISDEALFREMKRYYSLYFKGGMGAEAIRELLRGIDLDQTAKELRDIVANDKGQKQRRDKAVKRLEVVDAFLEGGNDPANMILDVIPVIPPDLRPMVQLDGGRFAASDLNDLYRRVINRNNRLKRLLDLDAPDIIVNNEKRMLQESVDALFDNGRRGRPVTGRGGRPLKSLAEALKGKQGRFRQNLLGKRVDYSGRSVIVVDPQLKLHQCGLPSTMALELFKPFVMRRLVELGKVENIKGAKRAIDRTAPAVWDVLEEVIKDRLVLLNRAPTLHRLSIQAFEPVLVEGKAIHLHPLVCAPFNADFDGDQMSVHVPLSTQAQAEARVLMLSSNNLRSPASGKVLTVPSQDMVFGVYYLTTEKDGAEGEGRIFRNFRDAKNAYDCRNGLDVQAKVIVRVTSEDANVTTEDGRKVFRVMTGSSSFEDHDVTDESFRFETTTGRIIFNRECLPEDYPFINFKMIKKDMSRLVNDCCDRYPLAQVEPILDALKYAGFHFATRAGLTVSVWDAVIPSEKPEMLETTQDAVDRINRHYEMGRLSEVERHIEVVKAWTTCTDELGRVMLDGFSEDNPIYMMADSGARGSKTQLRQLAGMRGLMADMSGDTIDLPIKANFREGLEPLEYFISTYGARKGLVDTASHTSDSGYLTRRLVDVAQDVIVREQDCGTNEGVTYDLLLPGTDDLNTDLVGRCALNDIVDPATGEVLVAADSYIESADDISRLVAGGPQEGRAPCPAHLPFQVWRVPEVLWLGPLHEEAGHHRHRRGHHRRPVHRRAGHPAHDAYDPLRRRRRRRRHHAGPADRRAHVRRRGQRQREDSGPRGGPRLHERHPQDRPRADRVPHPDHRPGRRHPHPRREARARVGALHARHRGRRRGPCRRPDHQGLRQLPQPAQADRHRVDDAHLRQVGQGRLHLAGRRPQRQAHRGHRAPDAPPRPGHQSRGLQVPPRPVRRPLRVRRGRRRDHPRRRHPARGRARHPRHPQGRELHRLLAVLRLVHPHRGRPHRGRHRGRGRQAHGPQVQRHRRQEDPGGHGPRRLRQGRAHLPRLEDRRALQPAVEQGPARVGARHPQGDRGAAPAAARLGGRRLRLCRRVLQERPHPLQRGREALPLRRPRRLAALDQQVRRGGHRDRGRPHRQDRGRPPPHRRHRREGDRGAPRRPRGQGAALHPRARGRRRRRGGPLPAAQHGVLARCGQQHHARHRGALAPPLRRRAHRRGGH